MYNRFRFSLLLAYDNTLQKALSFFPLDDRVFCGRQQRCDELGPTLELGFFRALHIQNITPPNRNS